MNASPIEHMKSPKWLTSFSLIIFEKTDEAPQTVAFGAWNDKTDKGIKRTRTWIDKKAPQRVAVIKLPPSHSI